MTDLTSVRVSAVQPVRLLKAGFLVLLQVYPDGIRHIRADKRVNEWKTPGKKTIVKCAVNQRQVVIALTGGELVYFEMDPVCYIIIYYGTCVGSRRTDGSYSPAI